MRKGETALFTLPPELAFGASGTDGVPPNVATLFEVELISWITVIDVCKDGGVIKRIMEKGDLTGMTGPPGDSDEVLGTQILMCIPQSSPFPLVGKSFFLIIFF